MPKSNSPSNFKKVAPPRKCPIPTKTRLDEFGKAHECIADIVTDPSTGVCYVKCVAGGKEIDVAKRYLVDDKVEIDDVTFTKNPAIAAQWILEGKNVGLYTGIAPKEVVEDNVIILDIDLKDVAPDEEPAFMAPREVIDRVVGRTLTIETRSGGLQCIFRNAIGVTGSPRLRYIDTDTGYLKDAGDTRIKHAYALFAGSYVAPDKVTSKTVEGDAKKPVKKPLPHADGLYRVIHAKPVANLTHTLLEEMGLVIGGQGQPRIRKVTSDGVTRTIDVSKAYSSYGHRKFKYTLDRERINALKAEADPDNIRNKDGKTLESISLTNTRIFNLIKPRADHKTRGVTRDESESAENMALAYEMVKMGFDDPDTIATAILVYQPREKNYEIRSNGISYLADTVAGAFDRYNLEQSGEFTEDELVAAELVGREPQRTNISEGRGYSHLYAVAKDDPNVRFETWHEFPPFSPDAADITLWRGDPRAGKTHHATVYLSQHPRGNYVTHRHEIIDAVFSRLVGMTNDTNRTIVWLEGKRRCCPRKEGAGDHISCTTCDLRPTENEDAGGIPFLEYQSAASRILHKYRAICKDLLIEEEVDYCPYYILKLAEEEADYCLTVAPFISPLNGPDGHSIQKREYLVIDEEPTIDVFYPAYPAIYEYHRHGFASGWDTNHLVTNDVPGQCKDILKVIKDANPRRVTRVNKIIRDICNAIIYLNDEVMKFSERNSKTQKDRDAFIERVQPKLPTFAGFTRSFKIQVMKTFMEHLKSLPYVSTGNLLQYIQPFLFPAPSLLVWLQGSHTNGPKNILYLMSDHTVMFEPEYEKMLIIGATESEVFVDHIRGERPVCRVDLELFPFQDNYLFLVAMGDTADEEDRILKSIMAKLLDRNTACRDTQEGIIPFVGVTGSKEKQNVLLWEMSPHGKVMGLGEYDGRADVVQYYEQGYPVLFYANSTIARGVDLPEYDVLFFVDGGFATPRLTTFEKFSYIKGDYATAEMYRNLRVSKVVDEGTNSAYRTAPLYTRKCDSVKVVVNTRKNLNFLYEGIYKHSLMNPVEKDAIDNAVDLIARISSSIHRTVRNDTDANLETTNYNPGIVTHDHTNSGTQHAQQDERDNIEAFEKSRFCYIGKNGKKSEAVYHVKSGIEKQELPGLLNGALLGGFLGQAIRRDRKTRRTYEIVLLAVIAYLKNESQRRSFDALLKRVSNYPTVERRKVTTKALENFIEEMIVEGHIICEEEVDFENMFVTDTPATKRWVRLNFDSPLVQKLMKKRAAPD